MKFRTTGILLVVFLALLGYVYFVEMKKQPAETPDDKSTWVLPLGDEDVQKLQVTDAGGQVVLVRSDDTWFVGDAGGSEADATEVGSLVSSLVNLYSTRVLTNTTEALSSFGLEPPALTVTLGLDTGREEVLLVGNKAPSGSSYYIQRKGYTPIHLVYASLVENLKALVTSPPYVPTPAPEAGATPTQ